MLEPQAFSSYLRRRLFFSYTKKYGNAMTNRAFIGLFFINGFFTTNV